MSKACSQPYDESRHRNHLPECGEIADSNGQVIVIEQGRFRLELLSLTQLYAAMAFFENRHGGSTRMGPSGGDHGEFQPRQSRLPAGINDKHNRKKVLAILKSAARLF